MPKLGETLRVLGTGAARKAGEDLSKNKKRKKRRLDEIMGEMKKTRMGQ